MLNDAKLIKDKLARQEWITYLNQQAVKIAFQDYERSQADLAFLKQQHSFLLKRAALITAQVGQKMKAARQAVGVVQDMATQPIDDVLSAIPCCDIARPEPEHTPESDDNVSDDSAATLVMGPVTHSFASNVGPDESTDDLDVQ